MCMIQSVLREYIYIYIILCKKLKMPNEIKPRASLGMTKRKGKRMIPIVQYLIVVVSKATLLKKLHGMS
jgi:hypothetical protein